MREHQRRQEMPAPLDKPWDWGLIELRASQLLGFRVSGSGVPETRNSYMWSLGVVILPQASTQPACFGLTHRPLSRSSLGLPYRILNISHKKELLRGLWVVNKASAQVQSDCTSPQQPEPQHVQVQSRRSKKNHGPNPPKLHPKP